MLTSPLADTLGVVLKSWSNPRCSVSVIPTTLLFFVNFVVQIALQAVVHRLYRHISVHCTESPQTFPQAVQKSRRFQAFQATFDAARCGVCRCFCSGFRPPHIQGFLC
jgi:hypothetical protein